MSSSCSECGKTLLSEGEGGFVQVGSSERRLCCRPCVAALGASKAPRVRVSMDGVNPSLRANWCREVAELSLFPELVEEAMTAQKMGGQKATTIRGYISFGSFFT